MASAPMGMLMLNGQAYACVPTAGAAGVQGDSEVKLTINGDAFTVDVAKDEGLGMHATLNDFIRKRTRFTGTKRSCGEGGCGACVVTMLEEVGGTARAVNSCLRPLLACNGRAFVTVEGVGSTDAPHKIQTALAKAGGSQCGFCTPGFTMSMYGLLSEKAGSTPTQEEIMNAVRGNICRCTGFRPIVKGFEDSLKPGGCAGARHPCEHEDNARASSGELPRLPTPVVASDGASAWEEMASEAQLAQRLTDLSKAASPPKDVMLVGGRTSIGIWKTRRPDLSLHIGGLKELRFCRAAPGVGYEVGALATLTEVMEFLGQQGGAGAAHLPQLVDHLKKVAAPSIRNTASIGGNVMLTYEKKDAPDNFAYSDVTSCLYGIGAVLKVVRPGGAGAVSVSFDDFYASDMKWSYLRSIIIPSAVPGEVFKTFRVAARAALSHSYVVGALRATVADGKIGDGARVVLGGIATHPTSFPTVEAAMKGVAVADQNAFKHLCDALGTAVVPEAGAGRVAYRKSVAQGFFYKFWLGLQGSLPASLQSATASWLPHAEYTASQTYDAPDPAMGPLTVPEPKLSALDQCTGEAKYTADQPEPANLIHVAPVLSTAIGSFTVSLEKAQAMPGYIGWFAAADMGLGNSLVIQGPVFAKGTTDYIDQFIGVVLAKSAAMAVDIARAVEVTYTSTTPPLVNIDDAIAQKSFHGDNPLSKHNITQGSTFIAFLGAKHVVQGSFKAKEQYHFHMETQTAVAEMKPDGRGIAVHSATQMPSATKAQICLALEKLRASDISVDVFRAGGGFGGKLFNATRVAIIAAAVTNQKKLPAKFVLEIDDNLKAMGQRYPWRFDYKIAYETTGKITAVEATYYVDAGSGDTEAPFSAGMINQCFDNCYNIPNWTVNIKHVKTQTPAGTSVRGPGFVPGIYVMEQMVAKVAAALGVPAQKVREQNYYVPNDVTPWGDKLVQWGNMTTILTRLMDSAQYSKRVQDVAAYNAANKWTKRGIGLTPVKYAMGWDHTLGMYNFDVALSANADGSVEVMTSGVEIGQGLNTKVAQTVCYRLGVKEEDISMQVNSTTTVCDVSSVTGWSTSSELCELAALNACDTLNAALAPVRKSLPANSTWADVCAQAVRMGVNLAAKGRSDKNRPAALTKDQYESYSAAVQEVLLDVLTGEVSILRTDILFDAGRSVNPLIDVGQVEGGYLMGIGYALYEDFQDRDPKTGQRPVHNTWEYHVPSVLDIPQTWNTGLLKGFPNPAGVLKTKATAEPPVCLGVGVLEAVHGACTAAAGAPVVSPQVPFPVDARHMACNVSTDQFNIA